MPADDMRFELRRGSSAYPSRLLDLPDAPPVVYGRGDPTILEDPGLAIVGSRRATPYGEAVAELVARVAAQSGIVVVSGGAMGVDQAAGRAAIDAGGRHVMVFGCGADVVYPACARPLVERALAGGGAVISLDPWGMEPRKWSFPRRNRIIAALSAAVVVTEAAMPSGTFSTAEAAMELDRELLAVPGSILSAESAGANHLIANGATCLVDEESVEVAISRVYGTLRFSRPKAPGLDGLERRERAVLRALVSSPMRSDEVAALAGLSVPHCLAFLSDLELRGLVERTQDGRVAASKLTLHAMTSLGHNTLASK